MEKLRAARFARSATSLEGGLRLYVRDFLETADAYL
jgi:hypothetical protein